MKALLKGATWTEFHEVIVPNRLKTLQQIVGGYIETVTIADDACVICNEDGRLQGLPYNCNFCGTDYYGSTLIVGVDGDEFCDVPMSVARANGGVQK